MVVVGKEALLPSAWDVPYACRERESRGDSALRFKLESLSVHARAFFASTLDCNDMWTQIFKSTLPFFASQWHQCIF